MAVLVRSRLHWRLPLATGTPLALLLVLAIGPGVAQAALPYSRAGMVTGIDVSHWQGYIRWADVQAAGVKFAYAKATDGRSMVDPLYSRNRDRADALGLRFGAYHFARPDWTSYDAVREADYFVNSAAPRGRHLLPALDLEVSGGLGRSALTGWVKSWLREVQARVGVKPVIYTTPGFWKYYMGNTTWFAANGYRVLWIAHWGVSSPSVPASDWGGHGWSLWQVSSTGKVSGIDGYVDIDLFDGTDMSRMVIANNR
jgi:GH25 family lysozyme M1 (1,4-beta-N-acetylmuramidase)